jgi:hypothetical protein
MELVHIGEVSFIASLLRVSLFIWTNFPVYFYQISVLCVLLCTGWGGGHFCNTQRLTKMLAILNQ